MAGAPRLLTILLLAVYAAVLQQVASAPAPPARASSSSSTYRCGWCPRRSTASVLHPDAGDLTGAACGYGPGTAATELAEGGFHIAAVSAGFFRDGKACGACYQLRCRDRTACAEDGVKVVVVSHGPDMNRTGAGLFLLSKDAFAALSPHRDGGDRLAGPGDDVTVDVDFRRIPCVHHKNLAVRVEETSSRDRGHLALRFLYQGGQTDIAAVEIAQAVIYDASPPSPASAWRYMTRREGSPTVWRTSRAPAGPLRLRIVVTAGSGGKWLRSDGAVIPVDWVPGSVYDTGLRITDVAASTCGGASCAFSDEDGDEELR
ncbi:unnamed protein product [Alopecurus aequalis]